MLVLAFFASMHVSPQGVFQWIRSTSRCTKTQGAEIDGLSSEKKWRKLVSWWITGKHGFRLSLPMIPTTFHCKPLVSSWEKRVSPLFPITDLSVCHVGEYTAFTAADFMHCRCSCSTSFHGLMYPIELAAWTCVIAPACTLSKKKQKKKVKQSKVKKTWQINILCHLAAEIKRQNAKCFVNLVWLDLSALSFTAIIHSQRIWGQSGRAASLQ